VRMSHRPRRNWRSHLLYVVCLATPSIPTMHKLTGAAGVIAYLAIAAVVIPMILHWGLLWFCRRCSKRLAWTLVVTCVAAMTAAFVIAYPKAQARAAEGTGSDADDALNIAARRLVAGEYPYAERTYLDHPISPLPGAVLLAVPFHLLGNAAYQNVFWMIVYFAIAIHVLGDVRPAALHLAMLSALSPGIPYQTVVGMDWITNAIYVMAGMHLLLVIDARRRPAIGAAAAVFLGLTLSSRANFVLVVPILVAAMGARFGWRVALRQAGIAVAAAVAVTAPFYFWSPSEFSPLHTTNILQNLDGFVPYASVLIVGAAIAASVMLATHDSSRDPVGAYRNSALVQMIPVFAGFGVGLIAPAGPDRPFLSYGAFFAVFGSLAVVARLADPFRGALSSDDRSQGGTFLAGSRESGTEPGVADS